MGISSRCSGRNLYNYLNQKKVSNVLQYTFNKEDKVWEGSLSVYDKLYEVKNRKNRKNKVAVLEDLMEQAKNDIYSHISLKQ